MSIPDAEPPDRRRPAVQPVFEIRNRASIVFVTVCSKDRRPILAQEDVHALLTQHAWPKADHYRVGRYVILPDHIHLFCAPSVDEPLPIRRWIAYWKSLASGAWPRVAEHPIWQQHAWDTQLRRGESYSAKWDYVRQNPVRHGLVSRAEEWPFQGELNLLEWHDD